MTSPELKDWFKSYQDMLFYIVLGIAVFKLSNQYSKDWVPYTQVIKYRVVKVDWQTTFANLSIFKEVVYILSLQVFSKLIGYSNFIASQFGLLRL